MLRFADKYILESKLQGNQNSMTEQFCWDRQSSRPFQDDGASNRAARPKGEAPADSIHNPQGSRQAEGRFCHQSPLGRIGGKQREGTFSPESSDPESWADGCDRQRRQLSVHMERKRIPSGPAKFNVIWFALPAGATVRVVIPNPRSFCENASYPGGG